MKETIYHITYEEGKIKCVRAVETKKETVGERSTPWLVLALGVLAVYGVMKL